MQDRTLSAARGLLRFALSIDGRQKPALLVVALLTAIVAVALSLRLVEYRGGLDSLAISLVALWICGSVASHRGFATLANIAKGCCVLLGAGVVAALASAAIATTSAPLADGFLDGLDRRLFGFGLWPAVTTSYAAHPKIIEALCYAYVSIEWQPFALILALCIARRFDHLWQFLTAWSVSLLVCVGVFALLPAEGAYSFLHIARHDVPQILVDSAWHYPSTLRTFRSAEIHRLDYKALDGIIAMPSFHACSAVLLAWGFGRSRVLAAPFWALNAAMWASSVPVGGHYAVDVLAGTALAFGAIWSSGLAMPSMEGGRMPTVRIPSAA